MKRLLNKSPPLGKHFFSFFLTPHFARPKPGATIPGDSRRMTILPRRSRVKASALSRTACAPGQPEGPRRCPAEHFQFEARLQTIRPVVPQKKNSFPLPPGQAALSAARVQPFSTAERFKQKKRPQSALRTFPFLWCRRGDSNSHSLARTRP